MASTSFENLRVYQLSENLADTVWKIVLKWDWFAKDTVGKQFVKAADSVGRISLKDREEEVIKIIADS